MGYVIFMSGAIVFWAVCGLPLWAAACVSGAIGLLAYMHHEASK